MTDQKSLRLRLPNDLYLRLVAKAEEEAVSLNTLMVSFLSAGLGETPAVRRSKLASAVKAAGLVEKLGASVRQWDGRSLRLYKIRGGRSASIEVATRMAAERARTQPWGIVMGPRSHLLEKREGDCLEQLLRAADLSHIREPGSGRPSR
jgi:hypothetical protein